MAEGKIDPSVEPRGDLFAFEERAVVCDEAAGVRTPGREGDISHSVGVTMQGRKYAWVEIELGDAFIRCPFVESSHVGRIVLGNKICADHPP